MLTILLILESVMLVGMSYDKGLVLDKDIYPVYDNLKFSFISDEVSKDINSAKKIYDDKKVVFECRLENISKNQIEVSSPEGKGQRVNVDTRNAQSPDLTGYEGKNIIIFGEIVFNLQSGNSFAITADKIQTEGLKLSSDHYFINGNSYNDNESIERELSKGRVKYLIPKWWEKNEAPIDTLPKGEGYFYKLDSIDNNDRTEVFSIFFLDYEEYVSDKSDFNKRHKVERAVIRNICPDVNFIDTLIYPTKMVRDDKGREFDYFDTNYKSHRVEFVFMQKDKGLIVMVYLYKDHEHTEDILYVLNSIM